MIHRRLLIIAAWNPATQAVPSAKTTASPSFNLLAGGKFMNKEIWANLFVKI